MASNIEYVTYVCEQMSQAGKITSKKMFGEYAIYCDGKCFALICDNQVFINPTKGGQALVPQAVMAIPYSGAKPRILLEELDRKDFLAELIKVTCAELPFPKPKKKKSSV